MLGRGVFFFVLILCSTVLRAQINLSPQAEVSLLTCGPGSALYASFGHTAIRVYDPIHNLDEVYNYGTFDFDTPNFYLKFVRGKLNYMVDVESFDRFQYVYTYLQRFVISQVLDLSYTQKQDFYTYLYINQLPENRYYLYDYFYNNCSTQPRDVILEVLGDSLRIDQLHEPQDTSLRALTDLYLTHIPWADFGIDLILGKTIDTPSSLYEQTFLPDYLMKMVDKAQVNRSGDYIPLVKYKQTLIPGGYLTPYKGVFTPDIIGWVIFVLLAVLSVIGYRYKASQKWVDVVLFFLMGLAGILMLMVWFGTDHTAAGQNLNILWALPTHAVVAFLLIFNSQAKFLATYFMIGGIWTFCFLFLQYLIPQDFHTAIFPLALALTLRSFYRWKITQFQKIIPVTHQ